MRVLRYCGSKSGCFTPRIKSVHKEENGNNSSIVQLPNWATAILNDGTCIAISQYNYLSSDCYIEFESTNADGETIIHPSHQCGAIMIDVNGLKGPNQYGADIFAFVVNPDRIWQYSGNINNVLTSETFDYDPTIPDIFEQ